MQTNVTASNGRSIYAILGYIIIALAVLLIIFGLFKFGNLIGFFLIYPWIYSKISESQINIHLAEAFAALATFLIIIGLKFAFRNRWYALGLVTLMIVAQGIFSFWAEKDMLFQMTDGEALKHYTVNPYTREIIKWERSCFDQFGSKSAPFTATIAKEYWRQRHDKRFPNEAIPANGIKNWFDCYDGTPLVYYSETAGKYRFFLREGYDNKWGIKLAPVTRDVYAQYQQKLRIEREKETEVQIAPTPFRPSPPARKEETLSEAERHQAKEAEALVALAPFKLSPPAKMVVAGSQNNPPDSLKFPPPKGITWIDSREGYKHIVEIDGKIRHGFIWSSRYGIQNSIARVMPAKTQDDSWIAINGPGLPDRLPLMVSFGNEEDTDKSQKVRINYLHVSDGTSISDVDFLEYGYLDTKSNRYTKHKEAKTIRFDALSNR